MMEDRIKLLETDLVFYDEVPVQTLETLDNAFKRVFELTAGLKPWFLIVDIRKTTPPTPEIRNRLQEIYADAPGLKHIVLITGLSRLLATVVRFVAGQSIKIPFTMVKDYNAALKRIGEVRGSTGVDNF